MQHLGYVLNISSSGNFIVKPELLPKIGVKVVDENLKAVGEVFDIIGPVKSPYLSIRPTKLPSKRLIGHPLYTISSSVNRSRKYGR